MTNLHTVATETGKETIRFARKQTDAQLSSVTYHPMQHRIEWHIWQVGHGELWGATGNELLDVCRKVGGQSAVNALQLPVERVQA